MSDFMQDVGNIYGDHKVGDYTINVSKKGSNMDLDMTDFITLMITQMTNQGIDDTMDTSEMLNQMVQMQMIQSMVNMTDATTMNYAASLVDKEVTVGKYNGTELEELVGTVTATGTKDGQHIIFINDEYYYLNEIMAGGRLPKPKDEEDGEGDGEGEDGTGDVTQKPDDTQKPDGDQKPDGVNPGGGTEGSNNGTGDGTTQDTNG